MGRAKGTTLTIHVEPGLKEGLRAAADSEHRSIANMIEGLIGGIAVAAASQSRSSRRFSAKTEDA